LTDIQAGPRTTDRVDEDANPWQFDLVPHRPVHDDRRSSYHQHACKQLHTTAIRSVIQHSNILSNNTYPQTTSPSLPLSLLHWILCS